MSLLERGNGLLKELDIPIALHSLHEITPTLLVAILESLQRERLPLRPAARESKTRHGRLEAMKVFLGVLGDDMLGIDLAGTVDPRVLAEGGEDEVGMVCEALLSGVEHGLFPNAFGDPDDRARGAVRSSLSSASEPKEPEGFASSDEREEESERNVEVPGPRNVLEVRPRLDSNGQ